MAGGTTSRFPSSDWMISSRAGPARPSASCKSGTGNGSATSRGWSKVARTGSPHEPAPRFRVRRREAVPAGQQEIPVEHRPSALRSSIAFVAVAAAALVAYAPSFTVPFQFDDYARIADNAHLLNGGIMTGLGSLGNARVIPSATLMLNYRLGGTETTAGYHVGNFAVHLLASLAVFQLALVLCRTPRLRDSRLAAQRPPLAPPPALLFVCPPPQT